MDASRSVFWSHAAIHGNTFSHPTRHTTRCMLSQKPFDLFVPPIANELLSVIPMLAASFVASV